MYGAEPSTFTTFFAFPFGLFFLLPPEPYSLGLLDDAYANTRLCTPQWVFRQTYENRKKVGTHVRQSPGGELKPPAPISLSEICIRRSTTSSTALWTVLPSYLSRSHGIGPRTDAQRGWPNMSPASFSYSSIACFTLMRNRPSMILISLQSRQSRMSIPSQKGFISGRHSRKESIRWSYPPVLVPPM